MAGRIILHGMSVDVIKNLSLAKNAMIGAISEKEIKY
jgi:hypothetical protein